MRTSRPYSKGKDFQQHLLDMKSFMHRGYRENVIDSEMGNAFFSICVCMLSAIKTEKENDSNKFLPLA